MPDFIGPIEVPEIAPSGTFPLAPDYPHGVALERRVAVHRFGSANAKIEQRYLLGGGPKRYIFRRTGLCREDVEALRDFWDLRSGPYQPFTYNAPADSHGGATSAVTVRFADEALTLEELVDGVTAGLELIQEPSSAPSYTVSATVTRFPGETLAAALLGQAQTVIPLVKITPRASGATAAYLSDRRCTVGGQLYQRRLIGFPEGITQSLNGEADQAVMEWGNADRVMRDWARAVNLLNAVVEISFYHVGSQIKQDFWAGVATEIAGEASPVLVMRCSDPLENVALQYPPRTVSRYCDNLFDDGNGCPFASAGTLDTVNFPSASADSCDQGFNTPNGCQAHGMDNYYRGIFVQPQRVTMRASSGGIGLGIGRPRVTASSVVNETNYGATIPAIFTNVTLPVRTLLMLARDEDEFFAALGVVGEGPLGLASGGHRLDGQTNHGPGGLGLRLSTGPTPNADHFSLSSTGDPAGEERAAGTAFVELRRTDAKGFQISADAPHELIAVVSTGLKGYTWSAPGSRTSGVTLTNPAWVAVNVFLQALRRQFQSAADQEQAFDVAAAIAFATTCATTVTRLIGSGTTQQFQFHGILSERKPVRDWLREILNNALGYYSFSFGKLRLGARVDSVAVSAYTVGNTLLDSLEVNRRKPEFNELTVSFAGRVAADDGSVQLQQDHVRHRDDDAQAEEGSTAAPSRRTGEMNLAGTIDRDQAARICVTRVREEVGGITAQERRELRDFRFRTTLLGLESEVGQVVSYTGDEAPGGVMEGRVTRIRVNWDYSVDIECRGVNDSMYDLTVGSTATDVVPDPLPDERTPELRPGDVENLDAQEDPEIDPATGQTMSRVTVSYDEPADSPSFEGTVIWGRHFDGVDPGDPGDPIEEPWEVTRIGVNATPEARRLPLFPVTGKVLGVAATSYSATQTVPLVWATAPKDFVLLDGKQSAPTTPANPWAQWVSGGLDLSCDKNPEADLEAYVIAFTGDLEPYDVSEEGSVMKAGNVIGEVPARNVTGERMHFYWQEPVYECLSDGTTISLKTGAKEWTADEWLIETADGVFEGVNVQILDDAGGVVAHHELVDNAAGSLTFAAASIPTGRLRFRFRGQNGEMKFWIAARDRSGNTSAWAEVPPAEPLARDGTTDRAAPLVITAPGSFRTYYTTGLTGLSSIVDAQSARSLSGVVGVQIMARSEEEAEDDPDAAKMYSIRGIHTAEIELTYSRDGVTSLQTKTWRFPWNGGGPAHIDTIPFTGWVQAARYVIDLPEVFIAMTAGEVIGCRVRVANAWGFGPWAEAYAELVRQAGTPVPTGSVAQMTAAVMEEPTFGSLASRIDVGRYHVIGPLTGAMTINLPSPPPQAGEEMEYEIRQPVGAEGYAVSFGTGMKDVPPVTRRQAAKIMIRMRAESASVMRCIGFHTLQWAE